MIRTTVEFNVLPRENLSPAEERKQGEEINTLIRPLVRRSIRDEWEVDLDSPRLPELVSILERLHRKKAWTSSLEIQERLIDDADTRVEWFLLETETQSHLDVFLRHILEEQVYPSGNAGRAKPGVQVAQVGPAAVVVSEGFKAAVEKSGLTGLGFLWVRDSGSYQALQWYLALPAEPLGRGVDHPWYDPAKSSGQGFAAKDPRARHGQRIATSLAGFTLRSDAAFGDPIKDRLLAVLLAMARRRLVLISYPRFLRKHLPSTDFAWFMRDSQHGDYILRGYGLAINRKARDLLIARRLIGEAECVGVQVLDRVPKGVENLDSRYGRPAPLFSSQELARLRAKEAALWAEHQRHPKPPPAPNPARALSLLRAAKRRAPNDFARPAKPESIAATERTLGVDMPAGWQRVLRVSNGGKIDNSPLACGEACLIIPVEKLAESQRGEVEYFRQIRAELPETLLLVMKTEIGDSIWLDKARQKPDGDCRVVLVSHETGEEEREWSSVAEFLEELLTGDEDGRSDET